jgi:hypothetical protein
MVHRARLRRSQVLDMRPIYHQTDNRVQAHIYVAALALLIHRAIEKKLEAARIDLSAAEAFTALKSVRMVDIDLGDGTIKRSVTAGTNRAAMVLRAARPRHRENRSANPATGRRNRDVVTNRMGGLLKINGLSGIEH